MRDSSEETESLLSRRRGEEGFYRPIPIPDISSSSSSSPTRTGTQSTVLSLVGPPGSGKTKLGEWIRDTARGFGIVVDIVDTDAFVDQYHLNLARVQTDLYMRPEKADKVRRMLNASVRKDIHAVLSKTRNTGGFLVLLGMAHLQDDAEEVEGSGDDSESEESSEDRDGTKSTGLTRQRAPSLPSSSSSSSGPIKRLASILTSGTALPDMFRLCLNVDSSLTYIRLAERHLKCIQEQAGQIQEYLGRLHDNVIRSVQSRLEHEAVIQAANVGSIYASASLSSSSSSPSSRGHLKKSLDATETKEALLVPVLTYGFKIRTPFMTEFSDHKDTQERMITTWRKAGYRVVNPEAARYAAFHCMTRRAGLGYYATNPHPYYLSWVGSYLAPSQQISETPADALVILRCDPANPRCPSGIFTPVKSTGIQSVPSAAPYMDLSEFNTAVSLSKVLGMPLVSVYMCLVYVESRKISAVYRIDDVVVDQRLWTEFDRVKW